MRKGGGAGPIWWLLLAGIVAAAAWGGLTHRDQLLSLLGVATHVVGHTEMGG